MDLIEFVMWSAMFLIALFYLTLWIRGLKSSVKCHCERPGEPGQCNHRFTEIWNRVNHEIDNQIYERRKQKALDKFNDRKHNCMEADKPYYGEFEEFPNTRKFLVFCLQNAGYYKELDVPYHIALRNELGIVGEIRELR